MEIVVKNVELRNRVVFTQRKDYMKRDGTAGVVEPRPYFTVDSKNSNGAMVSSMIFISDTNSQVLQNRIRDLTDHAKLELKCSSENGFDGMHRLVCEDFTIIPVK